MRKTLLRARKQDPASSFDTMGLIAKHHSRQSAEAEPILDNRSHRTIALIERYAAAATWRRSSVLITSGCWIVTPCDASGSSS
jgi:hypothetical protein